MTADLQRNCLKQRSTGAGREDSFCERVCLEGARYPFPACSDNTFVISEARLLS